MLLLLDNTWLLHEPAICKISIDCQVFCHTGGLLNYLQVTFYSQLSISPQIHITIFSITTIPLTHPLINHPSMHLFFHIDSSIYTAHLYVYKLGQQTSMLLKASIHTFSIPLILYRVTGVLEPLGEQQGTPHTCRQSVTGLTCRDIKTTTHTHIHTYGQFRVTNKPDHVFWIVEGSRSIRRKPMQAL